MKNDSVNLKDYSKLAYALATHTPNSPVDERLKLLREEADKIFVLNPDGSFAKIKVGRFVVPQFKPLYIITHLKRVAAFIAALYEYVSGGLFKPEEYEGIPDVVSSNMGITQSAQESKADRETIFADPILKEVSLQVAASRGAGEADLKRAVKPPKDDKGVKGNKVTNVGKTPNKRGAKP